MKKIFGVLLILLVAKAVSAQTFAEWFRQKKTQKKYLIEQIAALKVYAEYASKGYKIGKEGLAVISRIKDGDFNLHRDFFGSLGSVNPELKRYPRVADIMDLQQQILQWQKSASRQLDRSSTVGMQERQYCKGVYARLLEDCDHGLGELAELTSDGKLVMKDDERMQRIDLLYEQMRQRHSFCRRFSTSITQLIIAREKQLKETTGLRKNYGL